MWLRLKAELTLRDVASRAKVSHTTVADIERNRQQPSRSVRMVYSNIERRLQQEGAITK
jgi:transcriptional regulator with XRE-family HTH domain